MNTRLDEQLGRYGEYLDTLLVEVEPEQAISRSMIGSHPPSPDIGTTPTWRRGLTAAVATAALILVIVGAIILFARPVGTGQPAPPATEPPVVVTTSPETSAPEVAVNSSANTVQDLALTPDGYLWAATQGGVVRWDLATRTPVVFTESDGLPVRSVSAIGAAPDGSIWVAGRDWVAHYEHQAEEWTAYTSSEVPLLGEELGDLAVSPDGAVWVAVGNDGLLHYDDGWAEVTAPPGMQTWPWTASLAVAPNGTVWAALQLSEGVVAYDGATWSRYTQADGLPGPLSNLAVAPDGTVWVGGEAIHGDPEGDVLAGGLAHFDGASWTSYSVDDGLLSNEANVVAGPDGTVWAIHPELSAEIAEALGVPPQPAGLSRFDGITWTTYPDVAADGGGAVVSVDGTLWMGSSQGVIGFDGSGITQLHVTIDSNPSAVRYPAIALTPGPNLDPVRLSTVIGDLEFTTLQFPSGHEFYGDVVSTRFGPVAIDHGDGALRWSTDGVAWEGIPPGIDPAGLTTAGDDVIVFGDDGVVRYSWDGSGWNETARLELSDVNQVVFGPQGAVAVSDPTLMYSTDGVNFAEANQVPNQQDLPLAEVAPAAGYDPEGGTSMAGGCTGGFGFKGVGAGDIGPVLATDAGFVAITAAHPEDWNASPICEPLLWFSADGDDWELVADESPFGDDTFIQPRIAQRNGRFVAVGGRAETGAVWVSDDGLTWDRATVDLTLAGTIAAGEMGWILTGLADASEPLFQHMWFSVDGHTWEGPHERPAGLRSGWVPAQLAVGNNIVFGVGGRDFVPVVARLQD